MEGIRILVIDDDPSVHYMLEEYLTLSHYQVLHAYDGKEGLSLMESEVPDLVLLDVQMPVMDGFATLSAIRKKSGLSDIPILFLSGLARQHLKVKGLELGADDYIIKPFDVSELLARIKASLRKTARYRRAEGTLAGDLSDVSLGDLLQSMEMGAKTATIQLKEMDAAIFLEDGMIVHSRQGPFVAGKALERIFLMEKGQFSIRFEDLPTDISKKPQPIMSVLMEVLTVTDEVRDFMKKLGNGSLQKRIEGDFTAVGMPNSPEMQETITLENLVCKMSGHLKSNLKVIASAMKQGFLK